MWESRVLQRAFERLELHEGKLSRAVLRGGGGGDVTSLPDAWVGDHPGLPGPDYSPGLLSNKALARVPFPSGMVGRFLEPQLRAQHEWPGLVTARDHVKRPLGVAC